VRLDLVLLDLRHDGMYVVDVLLDLLHLVPCDPRSILPNMRGSTSKGGIKYKVQFRSILSH
jgi:hypothetical protein